MPSSPASGVETPAVSQNGDGGVKNQVIGTRNPRGEGQHDNIRVTAIPEPPQRRRTDNAKTRKNPPGPGHSPVDQVGRTWEGAGGGAGRPSLRRLSVRSARPAPDGGDELARHPPLWRSPRPGRPKLQGLQDPVRGQRLDGRARRRRRDAE